MISPEQIQSSNPIYFKTKEIENSCKNTGSFLKDNFIIKLLIDFDQYRLENDSKPEEDFVFALQNKDKRNPFIGVVNYYFKREGYCLNYYINGDIYFGYYKKDLRNKQGIYSFKPNKTGNSLLSQFYYGEWEDDLINGKGVYLWLKETEDKIPLTDFENSNFTTFCGNSVKGKFIKGALLSKQDKNNFIYYGPFNEDGKREGRNCYYYSYNLAQICYGTYKNGNFIEGYVAKFKKDGKVSHLIAYKKEENKEAQTERIKPNSVRKITDKLRRFREVILGKDYLNMIYEEFARILKFRDETMNDIEVIISNKYAEIMKCFEFNKISICDDIENNVNC